MQYIILETWPGQDETVLCEFENEFQAKQVFEGLMSERKKTKSPVLYRMISLDGELDFEGKQEIQERKTLGVDKILIQDGKIYNIMPDNTVVRSGEIVKRIES